MPFYEYQCKSCGHELEAMQKVSDAPLKKCPHCGKSQLQRLMSAPVFRLKGGGWYETDFKGDKDNQRNLADRPEEAPKESKDTDAKVKEDTKDTKEAKTDAKASDPSPAKETPPPKQKSAESPSEKSSESSAVKKPAASKSASRGGQPKKKPIKLKRR